MHTMHTVDYYVLIIGNSLETRPPPMLLLLLLFVVLVFLFFLILIIGTFFFVLPFLGLPLVRLGRRIVLFLL